MKNNNDKKRVKIAAAEAVLSAAAIIIILVCTWNVSIKNRTVDALNENASKAEATTSKDVPTSKSLSKQDEPKEKLRKELSEAKAKLSSIDAVIADLYFYDKKGNLMYMKTRFGEFIVRDRHMVKAECVNELNATEESFKTFIDVGTRIREDFVKGTLPNNYPSYGI